jgi:hypothetical protein
LENVERKIVSSETPKETEVICTCNEGFVVAIAHQRL